MNDKVMLEMVGFFCVLYLKCFFEFFSIVYSNVCNGGFSWKY